MADVFISYSRRNQEFVQKLVAALIAQGKKVWFDQIKEPLQGLPPGSEWWKEIKFGIEAADNFLFVISPEAIASPYCNAEVAYALQRERRLVTVLYHKENEGDTLKAIDAAINGIPEDSELPPTVSATISNLRSLARRNWLKVSQVQYVAFTDGEGFDRSIEWLIRGLDMDLAWIRVWSQLVQSAKIWADTGDDSYLWSEVRLKLVREMIREHGQELNEDEHKFIQPEQERLAAELMTNIDHARRNEIGLRLHSIGDTRPGVVLNQDGLPDIFWLPVHNTGVYSYKIVDEKGKVLWNFGIPDFYISKYLVTYKQFQSFIDAEDGFGNPIWWEGLSVDDDDKNRPGKQHFEFDNHPRETVSWYDAMAFCRWLNHRLGLPQLPTQNGRLSYFHDLSFYYGIRLPTEWEWEWAVAHDTNDVSYLIPFGKNSSRPAEYPWGFGWDGTRANTEESGLRRTTAVGMYPGGASRCGALDMAGNVREWCLNEYFVYGEDIGLDGDASRPVRGGSWNVPATFAKCLSRLDALPYDRQDHIGFRVCRMATLQE